MLNILIIVFFGLTICIKSIKNSACECSLYELEELEKLNKELYRVRIEYPNGLNKYNDNQYTYYSGFQCGSVALYDVLVEVNNVTISNKQCKKCTPNGWTSLINCGSEIKCDRDILIGQPTLHLPNLEPPPIDQKLFSPGQVVVVYKYSTYKVCKVCQTNGDWSKYPEQDLCKKIKTMRNYENCDLESLEEQEKQQPEYIRLRVESSNGVRKLDQKVSDKSHPDSTVVLYQTFLSNFAHFIAHKDFTTKNYNPSSSFVKKSCRYCVNGVWSDLESCTSLNCDKTLLTGSPELMLLSTNTKPADDQVLFKPYSVVATFSFGDSRFCRICHENGEWSRYPLAELCPNTTDKYLDRIQIRRPLLKFRNINDDIIFNDELPCSLDSLNQVEISLARRNSSLNFTRLYLISDIKQKLNPLYNAKIPSRSLSIYEVTNSGIKINYCSVCLNGIWTNITDKCAENSNINFCERNKLSNSNETPMKIIDMHNNKVSDTQEIFEPGSVMVIYELSETTRLCKICEEKNNSNADWSRYAEARLCHEPLALENNLRIRKFSNSCLIIDLQKDNETSYIKDRVMSWDAKRYLNEDDTEAKDFSMAVFSSKLTYSKYCRRCNNGKWDDEIICPIEFIIKKCDPYVIRGANFFVNKFDGLKLDEDEKSDLATPGNVIAVYQFGDQRYCKECLQNGTWSRFPTKELCKNSRF